MRVIFFGSGGSFSRVALEELLKRHAVSAVVVPAASGRGLRRIAGGALIAAVGWAFRALARRHGLPLISYRADSISEVASALAELRADLFCIASFPHILRKPILLLPRLGTINVHPSLLPKHRGSDPIFWTILGDDAETGVTLHWVDEGVDTGDVIAQRRIAVERGVAGPQLVERLAREAAALLGASLPAIENGSAPRVPQDNGPWQHEPSRSRSEWSIDYGAWSAERVWHVLRGVGTSQLRDGWGRAIAAGEVRSFHVVSHAEQSGTVSFTRSGIRLFCRDGWVDLAPPSFRRRLKRALDSRWPRSRPRRLR